MGKNSISTRPITTGLGYLWEKFDIYGKIRYLWIKLDIYGQNYISMDKIRYVWIKLDMYG
jgi:hypothetical protein